MHSHYPDILFDAMSIETLAAMGVALGQAVSATDSTIAGLMMETASHVDTYFGEFLASLPNTFTFEEVSGLSPEKLSERLYTSWRQNLLRAAGEDIATFMATNLDEKEPLHIAEIANVLRKLPDELMSGA